MSTSLNGFEIDLSAKEFKAFVSSMPAPEPLRALRQAEAGQWFFHWREGKLYATPEVAAPDRQHGTLTDLTTADYRDLGFLAAIINHRLPTKFPAYAPLFNRPFAFLGKKDELVEKATNHIRQKHDLVGLFKIRPKFELETRLIELRDGETRLALFFALSTKWDILALLSDLQGAGINLRGLHAVRRNVGPEERRLVGQIDSVADGKVYFSEAFDDLKEIEESEVWLEGGRSSFKRCLSVLLRGGYTQFDKQRVAEEGELLSGPGLEQLCTTMEGVFAKNPTIELTPEISCKLLKRLKPANVGNFKTVVDVGQGEYCFDPAKKKRAAYAWMGIERFGPYSRDTFPKKSPRILVLAPDKAEGKVGQFVGMLSQGVTSVSNSKFAGGLSKFFHLHNPEFISVSVPLLGCSPEQACGKYCSAIEGALRKSSDYDAALVAVLDEHADMEAESNPYLHAKAALLTAGVPVQEFRMFTATQPATSLQYILQNIALSLYAKMGGVPWTIDQGLAVDDEVVIGMGTAELSGSRFDKRQRYVGITTVFRGDGNYLLGHLSRDCTYDEYPKMLEENTVQVLQELRDRNGWREGDTVRVVFHAHKPLKKVEVAKIVKACVEQVGIGLNLQFAFLTVSQDHPFKITDPEFGGIPDRRTNETKAKMVPPRGRVVQLGRFTRLLCTKGPTLIKRPVTPLPSPVLIHVHHESTYRDLQYLSEQVLKFTNLSWRGTQPAEDPVTIYYSELIAKLLSRMRGIDGWSPNILNTRLRHSMWFL